MSGKYLSRIFNRPSWLAQWLHGEFVFFTIPPPMNTNTVGGRRWRRRGNRKSNETQPVSVIALSSHPSFLAIIKLCAFLMLQTRPMGCLQKTWGIIKMNRGTEAEEEWPGRGHYLSLLGLCSLHAPITALLSWLSRVPAIKTWSTIAWNLNDVSKKLKVMNNEHGGIIRKNILMWFLMKCFSCMAARGIKSSSRII